MPPKNRPKCPTFAKHFVGPTESDKGPSLTAWRELISRIGRRPPMLWYGSTRPASETLHSSGLSHCKEKWVSLRLSASRTPPQGLRRLGACHEHSAKIGFAYL